MVCLGSRDAADRVGAAVCVGFVAFSAYSLLAVRVLLPGDLRSGSVAVMARKNPAAVALGRRGGKVTSPAKAASSRENGKLGGRPKGSKGKAKR